MVDVPLLKIFKVRLYRNVINLIQLKMSLQGRLD